MSGAQTAPRLTGMFSPNNAFVDPGTGNLTALAFRFLYDLLQPLSNNVDTVASVLTSINSQANQITALQASITNLQNEVNALPTSAAITNLQNQVNAINARLTAAGIP